MHAHHSNAICLHIYKLSHCKGDDMVNDGR